MAWKAAFDWKKGAVTADGMVALNVEENLDTIQANCDNYDYAQQIGVVNGSAMVEVECFDVAAMVGVMATGTSGDVTAVLEQAEGTGQSAVTIENVVLTDLNLTASSTDFSRARVRGFGVDDDGSDSPVNYGTTSGQSPTGSSYFRGFTGETDYCLTALSLNWSFDTLIAPPCDDDTWASAGCRMGGRVTFELTGQSINGLASLAGSSEAGVQFTLKNVTGSNDYSFQVDNVKWGTVRLNQSYGEAGSATITGTGTTISSV